MADHVDDVDFSMPKKSKKAGLLGTRRTWVLLDSAGNPPEVLETGKHAIMRRTGLQSRDLRILDPLLGYPATLLSRERAIVVSLEHIKAIITAHEVLLLNSKDPSVAPFVEELRLKIWRHHQAVLTLLVGALELEVRPALNKLTSNISSLNLEHIQQIKGRLIPLTRRVQKVRDELESLLNDDQDMAGMYLTDKHIEWKFFKFLYR